MGIIITTSSCNIYLGADSLDSLKRLLSDHYAHSRIVILTDSNTRLYCLPKLLAEIPSASFFDIIEVPAGEGNKNLSSCELIWTELGSVKADRKTVLINLGGGMICDLGGFSASTYLRGIDFIQVPTSLLAMVDASSGSKTGINFSGLKNQIGNFSNPNSVIIYPSFLESLPLREFNSGFAEIIKHALIADSSLWKTFLENPEPEGLDLINLIKRSLEIKNSFVQLDPLDKKERHALNFGHTIGHALESYALEHENDPLLHGEAVALGMIAESFLSHKICGLPLDHLSQITKVLTERYSYLLPDFDTDKVIMYILSDKKNENSSINFSLIDSIGSIRINQFATIADIREVLELTLRNFANPLV